MEKSISTRLLIALFSAALLLTSACASSAQVTATTGANEAATVAQTSTDSGPPAEVRLDGAPLASKMGVCDAYDAAFIGQWVGIEDFGYTSFGAQSDGCAWNGDNFDQTHRVGRIEMIIFTQQSYEAKTAKFEPFVGGPEGSFIHNGVHVYLEHEGTYVGFVVVPTLESAGDSILPADNVDIYSEVITAMIPQLSGIEKA